MGDFNEIRGNDEKKGGPRRAESTFLDFRRMIDTCGFQDIKSIGNRFSWSGKRYTHDVRCCLDRSMANREWMSLFPSAQAEFLPFEGSDHRPLVTSICNIIEDRRGQFRYDDRLFGKEGFQDSVVQCWRESGTSTPLHSQIRACRKTMATWKRENRTNASVRIKELKLLLDHALSHGNLSTLEINNIRGQLEQAYQDEEYYWKMKSRNQWLQHGDRNTKFFYTATKQRLARNRIMAIEDENGQISRGDLEIGVTAEKYFQGLFQSTRQNSVEYNKVFDGFQPRVTAAMNTDLTRPISEEEVKRAVFDIGPHKAPGPDGLTGAFYQQFWPNIQEEMIQEVRRFFDDGLFQGETNHTHLCLIPKPEAPRTMHDFRPIALCNVSYKIIQKIYVGLIRRQRRKHLLI